MKLRISKKALLGLGAAAGLYMACPWQVCMVWGDSMSSTMANGSLRLVDRGYYRSQRVQRGDVVVFRQNGETCIKRVYGAPGEEIVLIRPKGGGAYELANSDRPDLMQKVMARSVLGSQMELVLLRVPEGHCFMLGDQPARSEDSRHYGAVPVTQIVGKVMDAPPAPEFISFYRQTDPWASIKGTLRAFPAPTSTPYETARNGRDRV